jgi:hypothetical protein
MTTVVETEVKMLLATTRTGKSPVAVGMPEITPELTSQSNPGGKPDAENPLGLMFAAI